MGANAEANREKYLAMLKTVIEEARLGLKEGGIPIGAAVFEGNGKLLGRGHNRRVQDGDPSAHGETDAFRKAGRQRSYRDKIMVTTLAPCWYCSGLIRQFGIGTVVVGESVNFRGGIDWLAENGIDVIDLHSEECVQMLAKYIADHPEIWNEDIGVD
jgi:cytosine/creatinine deaminase